MSELGRQIRPVLEVTARGWLPIIVVTGVHSSSHPRLHDAPFGSVIAGCHVGDVIHVTGAGLATSTMLGSLACTAPFAVVGLLAYTLIAMRAGQPLRFGGLWGRERSLLGSQV